jgi:hypothetical protein
LPYAKVFLVYDPLCGAPWSVSMCVECDGVLWNAMGSSGMRWHPSSTMPHEYIRPKFLERRILGHNFPNSTKRII